MQSLEERELNYIVATRAYLNIKNKVRSLTDWVTVCDGIDVRGFRHRSESVVGSKERRHFVVRKEIARRPEAGGKLLFEEGFPNYRYSIYVTNLDLPIKEIWNIYNGRADCENRIKELKADFGIENFCL